MSAVGTEGKVRHVLIVDDDEMLRSFVALHLETENIDVSGAASGKEMFSILNSRAVDLVLLDLNLPDEDGLALARQIRARSFVPIIIITSRTAMDDRLAGLEIGADDFLVKPFEPKELMLRVRNLLMRAAGAKSEAQQVLRFDGWTLDIFAHVLTGPKGEDVRLTSGEFNVLVALAKSPNRVLSRDYLLDAVSRNDQSPSDRMVDVFVSRLRKKIEEDPKNPRLVITVPGHGYKFVGNLS